MKRKAFWLLFLLILFLLAYLREITFLSVNAILSGESQFYADKIRLDALLNWKKGELIRLKYFLTLSFSILFISISLLGLKSGFRNSLAFVSAAIAYLIILFLAFILLASALFLDFSTVYPHLRLLIEWVHSPLIYLMISGGVIAYETINKESATNS